MATPPRVTRAECDNAIARISRRHADIDDPRRSELGSEPRDIVDFVLNRGGAGVPRWVQALDHQDALVLSTWCWWEERRRERRLLRQGQHLGLTALELAGPLGIRSRQGVRDRLDRLDALLSHDQPDEKLTRESRRTVRERDSRQVWLTDHSDHVRAVLAGLLAQVTRLWSPAPDDQDDDSSTSATEGLDEDIRDWVVELAADYRDDSITPATLAVAGLLVGCVRGHPRITELDHGHRLHVALSQVDGLRSDFAAIAT